MILSALLLAISCGVRAQFTAPATASVYSLAQSFNEAYETPIKGNFLSQLRRTAPVSARDVEALFDIFSHYSDGTVRQTVMDSLDLMDPQATQLEPVFLALLKQPEPEAVLIGIRGALKLRAPAALPLIEKLARKKLPMTDPSLAVLVSKRNAWWNQYQALDALAQWMPDEARPLLLDRSRQAPRLARLLAKDYWPETLPRLAAWMRGDSADQARAQEALAEEIPARALRASRPQILQLLRDPTAPNELRHQLAIRVGLSSQEDEVAALIKEHDGLTDAKDKLYFEAALFATRSPQVAPLLVQYAKENPGAAARAGARVELKDLVDAPRYREVVEWAAKNDPDPQNRQDAAKELAGLANAPKP